MPRRTDISAVLVIGSGPIVVIGRAVERRASERGTSVGVSATVGWEAA